MSNLGARQMAGILDPANINVAGAWTCAFPPDVFHIFDDFEIYHIAVKGPPSSSFQVYIDTTFYDNVARGDINSWDPAQPMYLQAGRTLYFYYSVATGSAPLITVFCREPTS